MCVLCGIAKTLQTLTRSGRAGLYFKITKVLTQINDIRFVLKVHV